MSAAICVSVRCMKCGQWSEKSHGMQCLDCFVAQATADRAMCEALQVAFFDVVEACIDADMLISALRTTLKETAGGDPTADLQAITGDLTVEET